MLIVCEFVYLEVFYLREAGVILKYSKILYIKLFVIVFFCIE